MQTSISIRMTEGRKAGGWLHKTAKPSDTLIIIIHGHNSNGDRGRFITLAKWFEHQGYDAFRWNAVRQTIDENTYKVLTLEEEYQQVSAIAEHFKRSYKKIVAVAHSQGGLISLRLGAEGKVHVINQLMAVFNTKKNVEDKLKILGLNSTENLENAVMHLPNGSSFVYSAEFFKDLSKWDAKSLYENWKGPTLFVKATNDTLIPLKEVDEAFSTANEPKKLIVVDDVHNFSNETATLLAVTINQWIQQL